ncbi:MAG: FmdB family zinc ribbon protein [Acidimicrobiales bacterium]
MPTYEYACTSCGEHTEVVQSFADEPLTECPLCGGTLRKVFGSIGIVLKGSGFYKTDSRTSTGPKAAKPGDGGDAAAKSDGAKSDGAKDGATKDTKESSGSAGAATSGAGDTTSTATPAASAAAS